MNRSGFPWSLWIKGGRGIYANCIHFIKHLYKLMFKAKVKIENQCLSILNSFNNRRNVLKRFVKNRSLMEVYVSIFIHVSVLLLSIQMTSLPKSCKCMYILDFSESIYCLCAVCVT